MQLAQAAHSALFPWEENMKCGLDDVSCATEALEIFHRCAGGEKADGIADLISHLGRLADAAGLDFLDEVDKGVERWRMRRASEVRAFTIDLT